MRSTIPAILVLGLGSPLAAQTYADADRLLAHGDTSGAIAVLERMVKHRLSDAEAHYRAGLLYMTRHEAGSDLSPNRRAAEEHFRYATRYEPDSAKYWLALSDAFRSEGVMTARFRSRQFVTRAREAAERVGEPWEIAAAAYRQARTAWNSFEYFGRQWMARPAAGHDEPSIDTADAGGAGDAWKAVLQRFSERMMPVPDAGGDYVRSVEGHLRAVLEADSLHIDAAGLLVVAYAETARWPEAAALTRRLIRVAPDSGRAWALHGLTLARTNRPAEALAAFDSAFARMTPEEAAPFHNLAQLLREGDEVRFRQMTPEQRGQLEDAYWRVAQPLALTDANETRTEFYARLVYAQHRWSDPWRGYLGHESDMGRVYVRYGPPDIATANQWLYVQPRFLFGFYLNAGFSRSHFAGESEWAYGQARIQNPVRFDNVPIVASLDTVLVQTAQFRGAGDSTAIAIFGAIPLRRMMHDVAVSDLLVETGAIVADGMGRELARDRREETMLGTGARELQYRSWRLRLPTGSYLLRVEALARALDRAARSVEALTVRPFPRGRLVQSDLLVASRVVPGDSTAERWDDFLIAPNSGRFEPGDSVGLLWEIYNLRPDSQGVAHYDVELWVTVDAIERTSALARFFGSIADALGTSAVGDDRVVLRYAREAGVPPSGVLVEHITIDLRGAPAGRYTLGVQVTDRASGESDYRERAFTVGEEPVRRGR